VRAREVAVDDLRRKRQVTSSLLLKHGRVFPARKNWGATYVRWLQQQTFTHPAQQVVLQEMHDPNAIGVLRLVMSLSFAGAGPATKRQRRDAKFPRGEG
jgi:hypothetical protein